MMKCDAFCNELNDCLTGKPLSAEAKAHGTECRSCNAANFNLLSFKKRVECVIDESSLESSLAHVRQRIRKRIREISIAPVVFRAKSEIWFGQWRVIAATV